MPTQTPPRSAAKHYALSALIAQRAAREAVRAAAGAPAKNIAAVARVVLTHQVVTARTSQLAVAEMLMEQEIDRVAEGMLNSLAFTTEPPALARMAEATTTEAEFARMVESIVQDAARAAESVATAVRPDLYHVRYVSPPCCSRCAILAGRVYRWSDGFERHTNCDCSMIPTTVAAPFAQSPDDLIERGLVTDLSKADRRAILDGADPGKVVNVRRRAAGLREPGRVLARAGRPTPEGIYRMAADRTEAVSLLRKFGYIT